MRTCKRCGVGEEERKFPKWGRVCQPCRNAEHRARRAQLQSRETIPVPTTKVCAGCGLEKLASEFYVAKQNRDGLKGKCKACHEALPSRRPKARHERKKGRGEVEHSYHELRQIYARRRLRRTTRRHLGISSDRARELYRRARRAGWLIMADHCARCGAVDRPIEGHHDDYEYPYSVRWLCDSCHRWIHTPTERTLNRPPPEPLQNARVLPRTHRLRVTRECGTWLETGSENRRFRFRSSSA